MALTGVALKEMARTARVRRAIKLTSLMAAISEGECGVVDDYSSKKKNVENPTGRWS